ncbi:hypothetical protein GCM10022286_08780 [Gryllotalpicola daejeonensis]|uniref:Cyclase n=1 Tax=Gryllotalpicola daejeonensis TaxID=993087 RepID=A0ABP7ZGM8_9MICO
MARTFTLVTETHHWVEALFDLSLDIGAHVASMHGSRERAVAGVTTGRIGLGETVTWKAWHLGIRFTMTSRILELDRPHRFVDAQIAGPFREFRHEHRFERLGDVTRMTDTITLASPIFAPLVEPLILVPYLRRLIARRNAQLLALLDREATTQ